MCRLGLLWCDLLLSPAPTPPAFFSRHFSALLSAKVVRIWTGNTINAGLVKFGARRARYAATSVAVWRSKCAPVG